MDEIQKAPDIELLSPGHRACAGCGGALALRLALKALGENVVVSQATGCMEVVTTPYPETAWRVPWVHAAFENAAAVASGVSRALKASGRSGVKAVAIAGDGGTADIGLQALSGAVERGEDILYLCYDNEAYMNTGIQRSGATPLGAWTTTTPATGASRGKARPKKDIPAIIAAHGAPYVATASVAYPLDFIEKVRRAAAVGGPAYVQVHAPCPPGWKIASDRTIQVARLAVLTGAWVLYEIAEGRKRVTFRPEKRRPITDYLGAQGRFKHLSPVEIAFLQQEVDENCARLGLD